MTTETVLAACYAAVPFSRAPCGCLWSLLRPHPDGMCVSASLGLLPIHLMKWLIGGDPQPPSFIFTPVHAPSHLLREADHPSH